MLKNAVSLMTKKKENNMKSLGIIPIVGARYRGMSQRQIQNLEGETVTLKREPSNQFDPNAIMCYASVDGDEMHIGYIPADKAKHLAPQMDEGLDLYAIVTATFPSKMGIKAELFEVEPAEYADRCPLCEGELIEDNGLVCDECGWRSENEEGGEENAS